MIEQLSVFLENKAGRLAGLSRVLGDAGVNMHALMVADTESFGVIRIICDYPHRAKKLLEDAGFSAALTPVAAIEISDTPGGLADVLDALDRFGANVEYAYCFVDPERTGAVDVFKVDDVAVEKPLAAAGYRVLRAEDLYRTDAE